MLNMLLEESLEKYEFTVNENKVVQTCCNIS